MSRRIRPGELSNLPEVMDGLTRDLVDIGAHRARGLGNGGTDAADRPIDVAGLWGPDPCNFNTKASSRYSSGSDEVKPRAS
jgi:hypothetical protein